MARNAPTRIRALAARVVPVVFASALAAMAAPADAQHCGWSHVDHRVSYDASGAWNPTVYRDVVGALSIAEIGGALWEGAESRFGRTMWQGVDAEIVSGGAATAGKYILTRVRPSTEDNPCLWFHGGSNFSFPSGEASVAAGLVTPYILEYAREYPATYLLALLPVYVGVGRIKNQAHWQSDVVAGWAVGGLSGWYAHSRETPIMVELLPHGAAVGLHQAF